MKRPELKVKRLRGAEFLQLWFTLGTGRKVLVNAYQKGDHLYLIYDGRDVTINDVIRS